MDAEDRVALEVEGGVAHLRLTSVAAHNAIDPAMVAALAAAVERIAADDGVRCVLLTADGPSFSVGGDLAHLTRHADALAAEMDAMVTPFHRTLTALGELAVPVVCAVQGPVAGGGLGLLWCADVVLLADDARLVAGYPRLALSGDGGSSWALPRLVGPQRALQFLMGGRALDAAEAVAWGIAAEVVPAVSLRERALAEARGLAAGPTVAYGYLRGLIRDAHTTSWAEALEREREAMVACAGTADAREGITSFTERRVPGFLGR